MSLIIDTHLVPTPARRRRMLAAAAAAATVFALTACAPGSETGSEETSAATPTATAVTIPDTAVGAQAQWVLDGINADEVPTEAELEQRFAPVVLEQLPVGDLRSVLVDLQAAAPWSPIGYEGTETQARVSIESSEITYDMSISVAEGDLIDGLLFGPAQPDRTPAASWDELRDEIDEAPFDAMLQVSDAATGEPIEAIGADAQHPIGSIFKLWVLGAVVEAVEAGTLGWEDELTLDGRTRSLPSGELQDEPDGTVVSVREAAEKMIAISDNTATDLLIDAVGRDAVVTAMTAMGHATPVVNTPLLTTRELFWLLIDSDLRALWVAAGDDVAARTSVLERVPAGVPDLAAFASATPGWSDGADWFATADDIVAAHVALQQMASTDAGAPVRDILAANPGATFGDEWTYVGFKGGSSIGTMAGSWYLERDGADPIVITVFSRAADAQTLADPRTVFAWVQDAAVLIADE